ncbi:hypothetical protein J8273_4252 [Carpediemonas membranifera]|uniref:Uncharacterized protein n=1 Tax=Carpediemonas membranifera TaxID=201153 RepID=A0A8J6EA29_9EUKA|nr:hypothetical protein J8273_4252 [Carpediemonas membranifera]|eukprot:KAG9394150.1 hypothetical protein J8273_4252 [Carpediemonas membranifera]
MWISSIKEIIRASFDNERQTEGLSLELLDTLCSSIVFDDYLVSLTLYFTGYHHIALLLRPPHASIYEQNPPPSVYEQHPSFKLTDVDISRITVAPGELTDYHSAPKDVVAVLARTFDIQKATKWLAVALQGLSQDYARVLLSFRAQRTDLLKERHFADTFYFASVGLIRSVFPNKLWPLMTAELQRVVGSNLFGAGHKVAEPVIRPLTKSTCPTASIRETPKIARRLAMSLKTQPPPQPQSPTTVLRLSTARSPLIQSLLPTPQESYAVNRKKATKLTIGLPTLEGIATAYQDDGSWSSDED